MVLDLLKQRRSIRAFKSDPLTPEEIDTLTEALLRSPSSRGRNPWEFILVTDPDLRDKLAQAKAHGAEFLREAPLAVAVVADPGKCDVWIEDCAIAAILLQMTAESLGLGSCWAQMRLRSHKDGRSSQEHLKEILQLPEVYQVLAVIGIGHPAEPKIGHRREDLPWNKIHRQRFGQVEDPRP
ncbi:nitroreductase family protein [Geoalkalibacter sp.]|jgi:nitroreductase|uniref:nitroreductase family protein n=1 Tax=Geoalkalibacter sp. TaxID=3041440 RepID=UPI00272EBAE4|nr:nitroreductase family protein [Geoalkalibacter sp.]